jgi:hypothetical protein
MEITQHSKYTCTFCGRVSTLYVFFSSSDQDEGGISKAVTRPSNDQERGALDYHWKHTNQRRLRKQMSLEKKNNNKRTVVQRKFNHKDIGAATCSR